MIKYGLFQVSRIDLTRSSLDKEKQYYRNRQHKTGYLNRYELKRKSLVNVKLKMREAALKQAVNKEEKDGSK